MILAYREHVIGSYRSVHASVSEAEANQDGFQSESAAQTGTSVREEPLRRWSREEAVGCITEPDGDAGKREERERMAQASERVIAGCECRQERQEGASQRENKDPPTKRPSITSQLQVFKVKSLAVNFEDQF